jgi:hypothetical protein
MGLFPLRTDSHKKRGALTEKSTARRMRRARITTGSCQPCIDFCLSQFIVTPASYPFGASAHRDDSGEPADNCLLEGGENHVAGDDQQPPQRIKVPPLKGKQARSGGRIRGGLLGMVWLSSVHCGFPESRRRRFAWATARLRLGAAE